MINSREYVAVNERTRGWYDLMPLIEAIEGMARLCDPRTYGLPAASEGQAFFKISTGDAIGIETAQTIVDCGLRVAISSNNRHPGIVKARLESRADNLELQEV